MSEAEKQLEEAVAEYERLKAENAWHGPVRTAEVQVLCAGDVCIARLPGEWFVEYGLDINKQADGKVFMVIFIRDVRQRAKAGSKAYADEGAALRETMKIEGLEDDHCGGILEEMCRFIPGLQPVRLDGTR